MRLSHFQVKTIKEMTLQHFGKGSQAYLFGSRVDDTQRGGDIDLFIEPANRSDLLDKKLHYLIALEKEMGEQKIDVIIDEGINKPIYEMARQTGVKL